MRDGHTRKVARKASAQDWERWAARWRATLVRTSGDDAGAEYELTGASATIGRGPTVDWRIDDDTLSKEHAVLEFGGEGLRLRDLGSMNGTRVNGKPVQAADLAHGDRIELGECGFQLVLEPVERGPRTYVIEDEA